MAERPSDDNDERGDGLYVSPPVQRAARLLRHIAEGDRVTNMSRTARELGINRTTLLRLLHTLESERFIEPRFGRTRYRRALLPALGRPCILCEHRLEHHRFGGVACRNSFLPVGERPRLALQRFRIGRAQLVSGALSVAELGQLDWLTRHDRRDGMLVYELRMAVAAEQHAEIIEPSDNALQLHSVHEKYRQRRLRLANVIEKRVLQTLRAFCCHGLPRPLGHAYAVHGPRISSPRWAGHIRRD